MPVVDPTGTLLGIVTESDLIRRLADEDERPSGWLARLLDSASAKARRYARSHGVNAGEVIPSAWSLRVLRTAQRTSLG